MVQNRLHCQRNLAVRWGNTILYIAALTSVDQEIYEAATLDGASDAKDSAY